MNKFNHGGGGGGWELYSDVAVCGGQVKSYKKFVEASDKSLFVGLPVTSDPCF